MAPCNVACAGCLNIIINKQYIICGLCHQTYDIICANITEAQFISMTKDKKCNWQCQACRSKQPKKDNSNTPVRSLKQTSPDHVTTPKKGSSRAPSSQQTTGCDVQNTSPAPNAFDSDTLKNEIHLAVCAAVNKAVETYFATEFATIKSDLRLLPELKSALQFISEDYDRVKSDLKSCEEKVHDLAKENSSLSSTVSELTMRLSLLEQHSRETNLEINGIPESRSENLITTIKQLATTVSIPMKDNDIITCVRVRKMDNNSRKPRSVIVRFYGGKMRDNMLAAVSKFNKANPNEKLHSGHL